MRQAARPEPEVPTQAPAAPIVRPTPSTKPTAGFYAATRAGKKKVTAALDPPMHKQLKSLALERDTTTEALLIEAIGDLFQKHEQPTGGT